MGKLKLIGAILLVFVVLTVLKNGIIQTAITASVSRAAHVPVRISNTDFSLLKSSIRLKGLKVMNPSGYADKLMIDAPLILIDMDPQALFRGQAHFEEVRLDLREVCVVKNKDGKLNIDAAKPTQQEKEKQKQAAAPAEPRKPGAKGPKLKIDKLYLSIGKVTYKDYSAGGAPAVQEFPIDIKDRVYTNIDNPSAIVSLIMFEALTRTTLSRLAGLDVGVFKDGALGAISGGLGLVSDGAEGLEKKAKGLLKLFG
ncbi:MAG TPA: AsmA family protein [Candidatus Eisenbacteria bacterium]|nr:AsmA family protein [Candidatus Eisenbacteria bacterium]